MFAQTFHAAWGGECENITHRHVGLVLCVAVQKATVGDSSCCRTFKLLALPRGTTQKPVASSQRPPPCSEIMSNSLASARMASAGQAMPLEAARNRSTAMMHKLHVLEDKYVKDWSQRIDLEVRSKGDMGQHVVQDACKQRSISGRRAERVDAALRASDERYAALGTILAPAPYKETLRTELVPGRIWGFEQCIALASVSTNIRMTAVRLRDGGLWVSAPIAPTRQCLRLLDELGKVAYLVIPSTALEHKASLAEFSRTYPKAEVWVTPGQAPPITVPSNSRILGQGPAPMWADELDCKIFYVSPPITDTFAEAVFFHKETRSLLVTDCALKLPSAAPKILESYGYDGTPGPISLDQWRYKAIAFDFVTGRNQDEKDFAALSRPAALVNPLLRFIVYRRCPEQAAAWVKDVARWPFVRIIPAHLQAPFDCTPAQFLEAFGFLMSSCPSYVEFVTSSEVQLSNFCLEEHRCLHDTHVRRGRFRSRNEIWAARAEAAHQWRQFQAQRKFDKCASAVALYEQKMSDYDAWRDRVMEAPRTELARRRDWLTSQQGYSLAEVDKYHKSRLG
eukprot:s1259_g13.t3